MTMDPIQRTQQLLAHADWVTRLSRSLVTDGSAAGDIAQEVWADVLRSDAANVEQPRGWLATIVRRRASRMRRTEQRRQQRERAVARPEAVPSAAELSAKLQTHRELTEAVQALDEPYRATILLRFFEHLEVDEIAERTGTPRNTVRSRLQRGLAQLRERLDRSGGRERWLPAVLLLAQRPLAVEAAAVSATVAVGMVSGIALLTIMKKTLLVGAALAAAITLSLQLGSGPEAAAVVAEPGAGAPAVAVASSPPPSSVAPSRIDAPVRDAARVEAPAVTAALAPVAFAVVDLDGKPLPNVRVRAETEFAVHWQGGDRGWINGGGDGLRLDAATEQRVRGDAAFAALFFAQFTHADEWRATVLDESLPARDSTTGEDGTFAFAPGIEVGDAEIAIVGFYHVLVAPGQRGRAPWIAGRRAIVSGTVRDANGSPLARARIDAMWPAAKGLQEVAGQMQTNSDDDGTFIARFALASGVLRVQRDGYETAIVAIAAPGPQAIEVTLRPRPASERLSVDGVVCDGAGRPIDGARVWFGRESMKCDGSGRFSFAVTDPQAQYALTAVAKGYALAQIDALGGELLRDAAAGRDLVLMLRDKLQTIRGFVLGPDGRPLEGARVGLLDPTLLDITFQGVEAGLGGFSGGVACGADGAFEIGGLSPRGYRLAAIDPSTGAVVHGSSVAAGSTGVVLRLPTDVRLAVRGRVFGNGEPLAGAEVEVQYCTHVTKGGGNQFDGTKVVTSGADGTFVLPALPRSRAWLVVRGGGLRTMVPVEEVAVDDSTGELRVEADSARWLQLVAGAQATPRTVSFELADGSIVKALRGGVAVAIDRDGNSPPLRLPATVAAILIDHQLATEQRLQATEDLAMHLRVR
jgi:RNA polymerase sigma-70 factor (ECF subfamily)